MRRKNRYNHNYMTTVIIPKGAVQKGEFVLIPREEYKALLRIKEKGIRQVIATQSEKRSIARGKREIKERRVFVYDISRRTSTTY